MDPNAPLLITRIGRIWQADPEGQLDWRSGTEMAELPVLEDGWILCEDGRIKAFGHQDTCPEGRYPTLDAKGGDVLPSWVDSHTHLVFAASREEEFRGRIQGLTYEEIARRGGGILNSAARLRAMTEEELLIRARQRLHEVVRTGTGAIEIKSGYGLDTESELKMLRVIRALKEEGPIPIRATLLAAHALPAEYRNDREGYIQLIVKEILPRAAGEGLADYIDVFCERNFFQPAEMERILEAGLQYGLQGKVHVNQFHSYGGIQSAIRCGALSVDHLEVMTDADIADLSGSGTYPVLLPSAPFFLNDHYPPARRMIDAGLGVALASDYNPGTSPAGRMAFVITLACTQMRMLPEEAINAATMNGACALGWASEMGSIAPGKRANLILTDPMPTIAYLPYAFGRDPVKKVILDGITWPYSADCSL